MSNPLKRVIELIPVLPPKDLRLAQSFIAQRDFESLLEIVESDIYKAKKKAVDEVPDDYISSLMGLKEELLTYMSYLDIPANSDDYDYY